ncbi:sirohydrochlorin chelatase [Georgenia sp. H159]|uniref:sirohydrochlorin chelatase n=1 Tax=Georgenia sp. H159 TaxID=3076115 RepID=UPI002D780CA1|nr:CbiX/SirB N-terminal domain-containing protein [Georgenia sp. H159]
MVSTAVLTPSARDRPVEEAPALVACSHGTSDPDGRAAVAALVGAVSARLPGVKVLPSFVDVQEPDVPTTLAGVAGGPTYVVPLLLSAGYHVHVDLADAVRAHDGAVVRPALGPDIRLVRQLVRRLHQAGLGPDDAVVLGAAGSSDARAVDDCEATGRMLAALLGREVRCGYLSATRPCLRDAVSSARESGRRVVVATYLLAPGYFADRAADCGADVVTAPLLLPGQHPHEDMVELVADRYRLGARWA